MSIKLNLGSEIYACSPRVKHNGTIQTPLSVWAKKGGVVGKVWERPLKLIVAEEAWTVSGTGTFPGAKVTLDLSDPRIPRNSDGSFTITVTAHRTNGSGNPAGCIQTDLEYGVSNSGSVTIPAGTDSVALFVYGFLRGELLYCTFDIHVGDNEGNYITESTQNSYNTQGTYETTPGVVA